MRLRSFSLFLFALTAASQLFALEKEDIGKAPIVGLEFFKSGLTIVRRRVTPVEGKEDFYFSGELSPAYGTFWLFSDDQVTISSKKELIQTNDCSSLDGRPYEERFKGQKGAVWFTSDLTDLSETLKWLKSEEGSEQYLYLPAVKQARASHTYKLLGVIEGRAGNDLILRLENKAAVRIPFASITMISGKENPSSGKSMVSLWKVQGAKKPFDFEYLTTGVFWAPSYRLELNRDGEAFLSMAADIRNELENVSDAEITLISGLPNVEFKDRPSLLDLNLSVEGFFWAFSKENIANEIRKTRQRKIAHWAHVSNNISAIDYLGNRVERSAGALAREAAEPEEDLADEEAEVYDAPAPAPVAASGFASVDKEQGSDISYIALGKHSMDKDSTTHIPVGTAKVTIERKAEWKVEPRRFANGQVDKQQESKNVQTLWDILSFTNPFAFPMTGGAMEVTENGHIYSQSMREWVNPGQKVNMSLTKALSLTAKVEEEIDKKAKQPKRRKKVDGENYEGLEKKINGKLSLHNYRGGDAKVKVTLCVYGELEKFAIPEDKLLESKTVENGLNVYNEKTWEMDVPAGSEVTFEYHYTVFEVK